MTKDEIIAEMQRKPDPQLLLEWISDELHARSEESRFNDFLDAVDGYFDAVEERGSIG